ncbi:MAG: hypothetical protein EPN74_06900 [Rhodanobacter sp.]|nr:MAG: hypothetical protein EPN74_06900 [Rhodanobacter sp.]
MTENGPLRLSKCHSALILFRETTQSHAALSFGGAYLDTPNVGVLGSHGASAVPLLATILAWGREGLCARIEQCMDCAEKLAQFVQEDPRFTLLTQPQTGIVVWRPNDARVFDKLIRHLPAGMVSTTMISGQRWLRNVAANPGVDMDLVIREIGKAAEPPDACEDTSV